MNVVPLPFELVSQLRDHNDAKVLQTIIGLGGVPLMHRIAELEDIDVTDAEAMEPIREQERRQVARDFGEVLLQLLVESSSRAVQDAEDPDEPTD